MGSVQELKSICSLIVDCPHSTPVWTKSGYVVLRNNNIKNGKLDLSNPSFTDEAHFIARNRRAKPSTGDIVITREAPMGEVCAIPSGLECCLGQRQVLLRPNPEIVTPRFILYALQSEFVQNQISWNEGTGSTVSNLRIPILEALKIPTPPIEKQRAIASILGSLDDKIEVNRRINQTLEAMAQAIFKSWFVDFDPVKAKIAAIEQGQDPERAAMRVISGKTDAELDQLPRDQYDQLATTAALFPDAMQDSELGEIPVGWEIRSLDSIANYLNGLALQKFPPESDSEFLPVIKIAQLRAGNTNGADRASARIKPEYVVENGDVLFSWSGSLEVEVWNGGRGALNQHLFKVTSDVVPKWFYYFATRHHLRSFRAIAANKATTMGHIQRKHLTDARIGVAPPKGMKAFDMTTGPLFDQMVNNAQESRTLTQLRDTLLPKLISGELTVAAMDQEVSI